MRTTAALTTPSAKRVHPSSNQEGSYIKSNAHSAVHGYRLAGYIA